MLRKIKYIRGTSEETLLRKQSKQGKHKKIKSEGQGRERGRQTNKQASLGRGGR